MKKTKYANVAQMVRATADAPFADAFERRLHGRRIVKDLTVLRAGHGLSQGDVAEKMGCTQSRISKLESSKDFDLTLGDLAKYASAVGFRVGVVLEPKGSTTVSRVKRLAFQIKDELDRLAGLAQDDQKVAQGVAAFLNEAFFNLVKILQESAQKLPCHPEDGEPLISFGIIEDGPGSQGDASGSATGPEERPSHRKRRRLKPSTV